MFLPKFKTNIASKLQEKITSNGWCFNQWTSDSKKTMVSMPEEKNPHISILVFYLWHSISSITILLSGGQCQCHGQCQGDNEGCREGKGARRGGGRFYPEGNGEKGIRGPYQDEMEENSTKMRWRRIVTGDLYKEEVWSYLYGINLYGIAFWHVVSCQVHCCCHHQWCRRLSIYHTHNPFEFPTESVFPVTEFLLIGSFL